MLVITVVLGLVSVGYVFAAATAPAVTGVFNPTPPGQCDINMKAWGAQDTGVDMRQSSAITVNNLTYVDSYNGNTAYRGFDVVTLDINTCKAANFDHFDTFSYSSDADNLSKYIYGLSDGTHILGVTSYDGFNNLNPAAKAALRAIGVDVTGLEIYGKLIFHAIAGKPEKTKVKTSKAKEGNLFYEEKAATCIVCQNSGYLKVNAAGTGFECQCLKIYSGLYCEKFSEAGCVEHFTATAKSLYTKKRDL